MLIRLKRMPNKGAAVRGKLYLVTYNLLEEREEETFLCDTLENKAFLIPPLIYRITVTYSPKFKRLLPLVNQVPRSLSPNEGSDYRSGIRFHPGSKPEHSKGCILVRDRKTEDALRELIMSEKEVRIEINEHQSYE